MSGFIVMQRAALDHPLLKDGERFRAWFKLLLFAAFDPVSVSIGGEERELSNGQVYGTIGGFGSAFGWNDLSVNRYFARLEKAGMISRDRTGRGVVITILDRTTFCVERSDLNGPGLISFTQLMWGPKKPVFGRGREPIPAAISRAVRERDGDRCRYCGDTEGPFELDHVLPHSRGGPDTVGNLVVACRSCNLAKRDRTPEEMGWTL